MNKLLVVDLQRQFKDKDGQYDKCLSYIRRNIDGYDRVYATLFSQMVGGELNDNYQSMLNWDDCISCSKEDLEFTEIGGIEVIPKNGYGIADIDKYITKNDEVFVIGCDTDACIMAVCFQLWDRGINFRILTEYTYTTSSTFTKDDVIKILKRNFGLCVI